MPLSRFAILGVFILSLTACGCNLMEANRAATPEPPEKTTLRSMLPNLDEEAGANDPEDPWAIVGKEGRGGQERERDPDQWYRKYFMSPQARAIERNMGID